MKNEFGGKATIVDRAAKEGGVSQVALVVKNLPVNAGDARTLVWSLGWEDPLEKEWLPTAVFLPGKFHVHRSLACYSPWDCKELGTTEQVRSSSRTRWKYTALSVYFIYSFICIKRNIYSIAFFIHIGDTNC